MKKILVIEDEIHIASFIEMELQHEGYSVTVVGDGKEGLNVAIEHAFDLILLDLMLPTLNGLEVCRRLKKEKDTPIMMLSAKDSVMDKVTGLQIGADDYLAKPFAIEELLARIEVIFRREITRQGTILQFKDISIDKESHIVKQDTTPIALTNKEYELLMFLISNKDKVISRDTLLEHIWGYDYEAETNVVDVYIRYLRNKFNSRDKEYYIQTVRSVGYVMRS